ncbi:MAG TPA: L,D-transpeptidase family protein [Candidatus Moranbacteria bacterium]|nr:L,D-transpeptidase family protein [Candidatus Moranbacteria bacterium]
MERVKKHIGVHHISSWKAFLMVLFVILAGVLGIAYTIQAYPEIFKTDIALEKNNNISPTETIVVNFSQPVLNESYESGIRISPSVETKVSWDSTKKKMFIIPLAFWRPETNYKISLPEGRNALLGKIEKTELEFSTANFPKVNKIHPVDGAENVLIGLEDPVVLDFDRSTEGFFLKFVISPSSGMAYQNNQEKTQFKLLPKEKVKDGETYEIKVYAKYVKDTDDGYKEIFRSSFETVAPPPSAWDKDFGKRIEQAKKYTKAQLETGKYIDINLESQILSIFEEGKILGAYIISTGKRGMDTPKGKFEIMSKRQRPWSKKYSLYMPWFMQFTSEGHGIHELPEWPGGYKEGANHLGIPVSHGCVRLGVGPAKDVYAWSDVGTPVVIH